MEKVITKTNIKQQTSDFQYWQQQTPQKRLETLEQIRQEYHQYKYNAQPRLQRIYTIIAVLKKVRTELNENGHSIAMRKPAQKILLGDSIKCISDSLI